MKRRLYILYEIAAKLKYDYYNKGESKATDAEYDRLETYIKRIEEKYPQLINKECSPSYYIGCPTQRVLDEVRTRFKDNFDSSSIPLDEFYLESNYDYK